VTASRSATPEEHVTTRPISIAEDAGVAQLVGRLTDDSKRLVSDEIRLAKLEVHEGIHAGTRGAMWLAVALGAAVVMLTALTVLMSVLLGRAFGNLWAGTLVTGVLELAAGALMLRHGIALYRRPPYSLPETRETLAATGRWATRRDS
jgi:protein-S-isoprenylcysteine O-methyltransferase Ste14